MGVGRFFGACKRFQVENFLELVENLLILRVQFNLSKTCKKVGKFKKAAYFLLPNSLTVKINMFAWIILNGFNLF